MTPEPLSVEPIPATTDLLAITVLISHPGQYVRYSDQITITTESGTFTTADGPAYPAAIQVTLLPNIVHHLMVTVHVSVRTDPGCPEESYTLTTYTDQNGDPLIIEQRTGPTVTPSVTPCAKGTAEPLWVYPIPATTDQLTITVNVYTGLFKELKVETESGTFFASGYQPQVQVTLLPNTVHHLKVTVLIDPPECMGGDYQLTTTVDRNGYPLIIEQKSP